MRILVSYRGIPQSPGWATGDMVVKAFRSLGHDVYPYARYYETKDWIEAGDDVPDEFDLLLFMECNDGEPQYRELVLTRARKTACWFFDTSYYPDHLTGLARAFNFDHQFIANPLDVSKFDNGHYLPYACDPDLHGRCVATEKTFDVSLIGSIREDRKQLQKSLEEYGVNLELIGGKFREEYIDTLAASKVTLNQNPDAGRGLLNMRFWEAQAAGSIVLTEETDLLYNLGAGLSRITCYSYDNMTDIVCNLKAMLTDEVARHSIAKIGQEKAFKYHSYENRCEEILEVIF